ncbi:Sensor histidine kinase RcsC [uncultured archaeon]|nr:Sensor histidine kinase RcsC [uncultured archaeon]
MSGIILPGPQSPKKPVQILGPDGEVIKTIGPMEVSEDVGGGRKDLEAALQVTGEYFHNIRNANTAALWFAGGLTAATQRDFKHIREQLAAASRSAAEGEAAAGERGQKLKQAMLVVSGGLDAANNFVKRAFSDEIQDVRLNDVVLETRDLMVERLRAGGKILVVRTESDVPAVKGRAGHIQDVALNLIKNASEAMGSGFIRVETRVEAEGEKQYAALSVSDTGRGMTSETLERCLEPFFTTKTEGTGLGLAHAAVVAGQHGGDLRVVSVNPDDGKTYMLSKGTVTECERPAKWEAGVKTEVIFLLPMEGFIDDALWRTNSDYRRIRGSDEVDAVSLVALRDSVMQQTGATSYETVIFGTPTSHAFQAVYTSMVLDAAWRKAIKEFDAAAVEGEYEGKLVRCLKSGVINIPDDLLCAGIATPAQYTNLRERHDFVFDDMDASLRRDFAAIKEWNPTVPLNTATVLHPIAIKANEILQGWTAEVQGSPEYATSEQRWAFAHATIPGIQRNNSFIEAVATRMNAGEMEKFMAEECVRLTEREQYRIPYQVVHFLADSATPPEVALGFLTETMSSQGVADVGKEAKRVVGRLAESVYGKIEVAGGQDSGAARIEHIQRMSAPITLAQRLLVMEQMLSAGEQA